MVSWEGYPSGTADERSQLTGYLDLQRRAVVKTIDGLTEEQARWKPAPTANSLLNLVVHLSGVERNWCQYVTAGRTVERDRDAELAELPAEVTVSTAVATYRQVCRENNEIVGGLNLDEPCRGEGMDGLNVRWVLLHMIEETARHAGHADITRELIDGVVGD